jgi:hypothetical protein
MKREDRAASLDGISIHSARDASLTFSRDFVAGDAQEAWSRAVHRGRG